MVGHAALAHNLCRAAYFIIQWRSWIFPEETNCLTIWQGRWTSKRLA